MVLHILDLMKTFRFPIEIEMERGRDGFLCKTISVRFSITFASNSIQGHVQVKRFDRSRIFTRTKRNSNSRFTPLLFSMEKNPDSSAIIFNQTSKTFKRTCKNIVQIASFYTWGIVKILIRRQQKWLSEFYLR